MNELEYRSFRERTGNRFYLRRQAALVAGVATTIHQLIGQHLLSGTASSARALLCIAAPSLADAYR